MLLLNIDADVSHSYNEKHRFWLAQEWTKMIRPYYYEHHLGHILLTRDNPFAFIRGAPEYHAPHNTPTRRRFATLPAVDSSVTLVTMAETA